MLRNMFTDSKEEDKGKRKRNDNWGGWIKTGGRKKRLGKDKKKTENGTMNYKFKAVMIPPPQKKMQSEPVEVSWPI